MVDFQQTEEVRGDFPHKLVLGLVLFSRFAPPSDHKQHRNAVHIGVDERGVGVHDISQAAVLHIDAGGAAGPEIRAHRHADRRALISGAAVVETGPVLQIGAEFLQGGVGNSDHGFYPQGFQDPAEFLGFHWDTASFSGLYRRGRERPFSVSASRRTAKKRSMSS